MSKTDAPANASDIVAVSAPGAPPPGGHYSQAITHGGLVYASGQLPVQAGKPHDAAPPFEAQARRALANLFAVLAAAGSGPESLLKVTVYIVGVENWPAFNAVYAEILGDARPARSVVPVPHLHYGYLVEIDAIAAQNPK
ncbi:RidA family protein [Aquabacter cavernae]|uniref:RidA family protein n=1 Tax=Aquabacter cavernae TaxID=2496029 RepID=UPI000F8E92AC|nr:RidA family protein [Aquabacter cavernae]